MREVGDWLTSYKKYLEETESPRIFHTWVGLSCISAALRKKVKFGLGRINIYPNMYVVLVGPPGARKSQAISYGQEILSDIPDVVTSSDSTTPEAFIRDLADAVQSDPVPPRGEMFTHSSLTVISKEFEIFLGNKLSNQRMLVLLTDFWDAPERPWVYKVKHGRSDTIPSVFLSLLAATTPNSLSNSLPQSAIGGGLTSRIMFVYSQTKQKKIPIPEMSNNLNKLQVGLKKDLFVISKIAGSYVFSPEAKKMWIKWYNSFNDLDPDRLCKDPSFTGWYERKQTQIIKVSQLVAASQSSNLTIEESHIKRAIKIIEECEVSMAQAFTGVGRSNIAIDTDAIMSIIRQHKKISETKLRAMVWRDIDSQKFNLVMDTLYRGGFVSREYKMTDKDGNEVFTRQPGINASIWYKWEGE